jgi:hypothetical protein
MKWMSDTSQRACEGNPHTQGGDDNGTEKDVLWSIKTSYITSKDLGEKEG